LAPSVVARFAVAVHFVDIVIRVRFAAAVGGSAVAGKVFVGAEKRPSAETQPVTVLRLAASGASYMIIGFCSDMTSSLPL